MYDQKEKGITMKGCSLFSGAGIAEAFLKEAGIKIEVANELVERRSKLYQQMYPDTLMIQGDIMDDHVFNKILNASGNGMDFLLATPPCQGVSVAGKNRKNREYLADERNYLIFRAFDYISKKLPNYILIENVPIFLSMLLPHEGHLYGVEKILEMKFGKEYEIESQVLDSSHYGIPQRRKRAFIKMYKKGLRWDWPKKENEITVHEAIGHLPSLESGERSKISWHFARKHIKRHVLWMKHTPTGKSAYENKVYYPQKKDGTRIKGYESSYRRIHWNKPAPTISIRNDAVSSQRNVHPGRKLPDGTYSDARVLSVLELMILSSLPEYWSLPEDTPELLIRQCLGESIPPLLVKKIVSCIGELQ